jgi:hypothetical protein
MSRRYTSSPHKRLPGVLWDSTHQPRHVSVPLKLLICGRPWLLTTPLVRNTRIPTKLSSLLKIYMKVVCDVACFKFFSLSGAMIIANIFIHESFAVLQFCKKDVGILLT